MLDRAVLDRPTLEAARALLGCRLVRDPPTAGAGETRVGRIIEVEAYIGEEDGASHARFGPTARNRAMYGPPGIAYVYLVYGMYDCLNIVTEPAGTPAAVLVRAVEPLGGIDTMRTARLEHAVRRRRGVDPTAEARRLAGLPAARLTDGPGSVAAAFGLDRGWTGVDLCDPAARLRLEPGDPADPALEVSATPRIGVAYASEPWASRPWRLVAARHPDAPATGDR